MWKKWEATEAPLRQGRGWYPTLVCPFPPPLDSQTDNQDRHFLELLVVSEIHCLSHPLSVYSNPTAEKVHRHGSRVRRVACERIGAERLHAYCDRVKEAFEAYMQGGWGRGYVRTDPSDADEIEGEDHLHDHEDEDEDEEGRGRVMDREGSEVRAPLSPPKDKDKVEEDEEVKMVVDLSPLSPSPSLSSTDSGSGDESDTSLETASSFGYGFMEDGERELMKIDLEGVIEVEEECEVDIKLVLLFVLLHLVRARDAPLISRKAMLENDDKIDTSPSMDVDVVLGTKIPTIQIITPNND
jgi:hypothetical protein